MLNARPLGYKIEMAGILYERGPQRGFVALVLQRQTHEVEAAGGHGAFSINDG